MQVAVAPSPFAASFEESLFQFWTWSEEPVHEQLEEHSLFQLQPIRQCS